MTSRQVLDLKGNKVRDLGLDDEVFGVEPNVGLMHSAVIRQLANARSGSANTKTRSEVRGGGKKPWRQKGTGRARAGSIRSPLWEGGGVTFGPKPRDYSISMPRKQRLLALKSAVAASQDKLVVVEGLAAKNAKTKEVAQVLDALKITGKKILLVLDYSREEDCKLELAARNIDKLVVVNAANLSVHGLLNSEVVLTTESTLETITRRLKSLHKEKSPAAGDSKTKTHKAEKATAKKAEPAAKKSAKAAPAKKAEAKKPKAETKSSKAKSE
ncbi:MAG TPA: 50S ribosomal protein L4 [Chroococcales cyanobacterium]